MLKSTWRGNSIYEGVGVVDVWRYSSDNTLVVDDPYRTCGHCNKDNTKAGHDACVGTLPNVMNACCGHGNPNDAYIQFDAANIIHGTDALHKIVSLQGKNNE